MEGGCRLGFMAVLDLVKVAVAAAERRVGVRRVIATAG